jgi:hypothetical protein
MQTYTHVGETQTKSAWLTNDEGYDVASIERVAAHNPELPLGHHLTDEEWRRMLNLINAAPKLLSTLQSVADDGICMRGFHEQFRREIRDVLDLTK